MTRGWGWWYDAMYLKMTSLWLNLGHWVLNFRWEVEFWTQTWCIWCVWGVQSSYEWDVHIDPLTSSSTSCDGFYHEMVPGRVEALFPKEKCRILVFFNGVWFRLLNIVHRVTEGIILKLFRIKIIFSFVSRYPHEIEY